MSEEKHSSHRREGGYGGGRDRRGAKPRGGKPGGRRGGRGHGRDDRFSGKKVRHDRSNPSRQGFREDRMAKKAEEPDLPDGIDINGLDRSVLQDLRVLSKDNANRVAQHMVMAIEVLEDDPQLALRHARAAKNRAGRVGVVRETNGVVAYHAGEWKEALSELRAARRMSGGPGLLAVMADAERGLGRPEKALELGRTPEARQLNPEDRIELGIVLAGARHDLGQHESALATLSRFEPTQTPETVSQLRLAYANAEALLSVGRKDEAKEWFQSVAEADAEGMTDAEERVRELS